MDKPEKLKLKTEDLTKENIKKLGELFPDILTEVEKDGKLIKTIDIERLKEVVGDYADKDSEIYQLTWAGKQNARRTATEPTTKTLRPVIEDSVDFEKTENLYIEGDNLEVLKILRKSYTNSIKAIYIDPPYNTGTAMIYNNDFKESDKEYESKAGIRDEEGNRLFTNTGSDGKFHSNWLNMMYTRIQLAYKLLTKDGYLILAIDHNELHNLISISDEVFGEQNRLGIITVVHKPEGRQTTKFFNPTNEYMLVYTKDSSIAKFNEVAINEEIKESFDRQDKKGKYKIKNYLNNDMMSRVSRKNKPNFWYPIYVSKDLKELTLDKKNNFYEIYPITKNNQEKTWQTIPSTTKRRILEGEILAEKDIFGNVQIFYKFREQQRFKTHWIAKKYNATSRGTRVVNNLLNGNFFDFPKSINLVEDILKITTNKSDIILDFFSGSATTAHAVMQLNAEDNGNRKYIMVQLPEEIEEGTESYKAGYKNICEIGKERIRRAAKKIQEDNKDKDLSNVDFGFRVFKLDSSNMKETYYNPGMIDQKTLANFKDSIKEDRTEEDILYQVLLDMGIPLSANIEIKSIQDKKVFVVNDGWLVACFDDNIDLELVKELAKIKSEVQGLKTKFVFRESSFKDDSAMINTMEYLKTIIFKTDAELKSNVKVV